MTSAQVVEMSVKVTTNSPSQDYTHLDDHNLIRTYDMTPGFKPFTIIETGDNFTGEMELVMFTRQAGRGSGFTFQLISSRTFRIGRKLSGIAFSAYSVISTVSFVTT